VSSFRFSDDRPRRAFDKACLAAGAIILVGWVVWGFQSGIFREMYHAAMFYLGIGR
jgi:hypothetical protein